jgi:hypothetical protein
MDATRWRRPGGEHIRSRGPQVLVHDDAVVDRKPRRLRELDARHHAHPDHGNVAFDRRAGRGSHPPGQAVALKGLDSLTQQQLDPMLRVRVAVELSDLAPEDPLVGQLQRIDQHDLESAMARRGGDMTAQIEGARGAPRNRSACAGSRPPRAPLPRSESVAARPRWSRAAGPTQARARPQAVTRLAAGSIALTAVPVSSSISCWR